MGLVRALRLKVKIGPLLACAAAGATCACTSLPNVDALGPPPIDPTSAVARDVAAASKSDAPFPSFANLPNAPTDVRPVRAWTRSIYDTLRLRRQLIVEAALAGPPVTDTDAFVQAQRDRTAAPTSSAAQANGQTAFVAGARERATPPSSAR